MQLLSWKTDVPNKSQFSKLTPCNQVSLVSVFPCSTNLFQNVKTIYIWLHARRCRVRRSCHKSIKIGHWSTVFSRIHRCGRKAFDFWSLAFSFQGPQSFTSEVPTTGRLWVQGKLRKSHFRANLEAGHINLMPIKTISGIQNLSLEFLRESILYSTSVVRSTHCTIAAARGRRDLSDSRRDPAGQP